MQAAAGGFSNEIFRPVEKTKQAGYEDASNTRMSSWLMNESCTPRGRPGARVRVWHTESKVRSSESEEHAERSEPAAVATQA